MHRPRAHTPAPTRTGRAAAPAAPSDARGAAASDATPADPHGFPGAGPLRGGGPGAPQAPAAGPASGDRAAAAAAWCCGAALLALVLWTLPGFFGPHAAYPAAMAAGAALGYLCCGTHPLSRSGRWVACEILAAAAVLFAMRWPAAPQLLGQARFLLTAWADGSTPAVPALAGRPLIAACAWLLACASFAGLRAARPMAAVLALLGTLLVEWEFLDHAAGRAFWPAAGLALIWLASGWAQSLSARPPLGGTASADRWAAWRPLALAVPAGLGLLAAVSLLPLARPPLDLGAFGSWLQRAVPAIAGIERSARLPAAGAAPALLGPGGALAPAAPFGLQAEGFATSDARLGGPLASSDAEALRLTVLAGSPPPTIYLRGVALDTYTGRGWVESPAALESGPPPFPRRGRGSFEFRVQPTGIVTSTLFTVLTPASADLRPLFWDRLGNAWLPDPLPPSAAYVVRAVPPPDPAALPRGLPFFRRFGGRGGGRGSAAYLQLPPSLPPQVGRLARRWAGGTASPIAQALAVERHLLAIPYDLNAPAPPPGSDFVASFLFQLHRGYCTYYASAMAVMLRTLGIPTRWVTGFRLPAPAPGRTAVVTDAEAHAWVEAFIPPYGWLTFDPTPPGPTLSSPDAAVPAPAPAPAAAAARTATEPAAAPGSALSGVATRVRRAAAAWTPPLLAALTAALAGLALERRRRTRRLERLDPVAAAHRRWRALERAAARRGHPRPQWATTAEFAASLAERWPAGAAELARLAGAYERLCYGPAETRPAAAADLSRACRTVAAELRRLPRGGTRTS